MIHPHLSSNITIKRNVVINLDQELIMGGGGGDHWNWAFPLFYLMQVNPGAAYLFLSNSI